MAKLVIGAFTNQEEADEAILELEEAGVVPTDFVTVQQKAGKAPAAQAPAAKATIGELPVYTTATEIIDTLVELGVSRETAKQQESIIEMGGVLLGTEDNAVSEHEIRVCLNRHRAEQIAVVPYPKLANASPIRHF